MNSSTASAILHLADESRQWLQPDKALDWDHPRCKVSRQSSFAALPSKKIRSAVSSKGKETEQYGNESPPAEFQELLDQQSSKEKQEDSSSDDESVESADGEESMTLTTGSQINYQNPHT
jgi:hypothetical protein